jgi:spermidine synthase
VLPGLPASKSTRRLILLAVGGLGVSSVMTQLGLMRELLEAFSGNELVLGAILGNWLLLTGLGAALGRTASRLRARASVLVWCQVLIALTPLAQVFLLRALRNVVFIRGATVGITETVLSSLILLLPYCAASGCLLTLACGMLSRIGPDISAAGADGSREFKSQTANCKLQIGNCKLQIEHPSAINHQTSNLNQSASASHEGAAGIGRVYVADSLGSILGGALFSFILIQWFDHFSLLCFPALLNLLLAGLLASHFGKRTLWKVAGTAFLWVLWLMVAQDVDGFSTALQYSRQQVVFRGNSPYGRLVVTRSAGQLNFVENGVPVFSTHNIEQVEETVHYAMAQRPEARRVLLVSGGISGTASEILKYNPLEVTYVELDPLILQVGRQYLPESLADSRIKVVNTDGRLFIKQAAQRFDVVIVAVPDPSTSQLNRFYTAEFFAEAKRALASQGVLAFSLGHYENYVSPGLGRLLASAHQTLRQSFTNTMVIPGGRVFFLASDGPLHADIAGRLAQRRISTQLVNPHYLGAMLAPDRLADMRRATEQPAAINRDFSPVLYYYHLVHWLSQFKVRFGLLAGLLAGLFLACLVLLGRRAVALGAGAVVGPLVLFASGFAASALEVVLLLGFQILHGTLYRQIGVIVTLFMAGLAVGAYWTNRWAQGWGRRALGILAGAIAVLAALLPLLLSGLGRLGHPAFAALGAQAGIPLLALVLAALVGMQFPLASRLECRDPAATAARLYTADFLGACLGAFLASTLLLPLLGVTATCLLTAGLNLVAGAVAWLTNTNRRA